MLNDYYQAFDRKLLLVYLFCSSQFLAIYCLLFGLSPIPVTLTTMVIHGRAPFPFSSIKRKGHFTLQIIERIASIFVITVVMEEKRKGTSKMKDGGIIISGSAVHGFD